MSESQEFKLPDVGEGLTEAEVTAWHVAVGDEVAVNDVIVDIETAKSVVELPSPFAGVVEQLLVDVGVTVPVGTPLVRIGVGDAAAVHDTSTRDSTVTPDAPAAVNDEDAPQVLVGAGPREAAGRRRRLGGGRPTGGTGATVTRRDVAEAASGRSHCPAASIGDSHVLPGSREVRLPIRGVRKTTAAAMVKSAFTAPHVTEWLTVDMTRSMDLVRRLKRAREWQDVRVTPLVVVARAFLIAVHSYPEINASWDEEHGEIVQRRYVNLGIATATPRGLLVPNIKDAHELDLRSLAESLQALIETARAGRTQPPDMTRGTVTITNIGAFGVDAGTPILNPGESAILAFGAVRQQPWVVGGDVRVREVTQLAMSFDHRLVDGALGSRVLARTGEILTDPGVALLYA
jgi:pyruvate dehydrogenase E2 component (dihydrolipoamide acetyltransferase)